MKERHWTNDPELIERFVLHQVNPEERNELEDHLRICEVCKRSVRAEQMLIAGIRRSGREQFKSTLAAKLATIPTGEKKTPWVKLLSAAAVIIILVTAGIYNRWFEMKKEPAVEPIPDIAQQSQESAPAATEKDESLGAVPRRDANVPFAEPQAKSPTQDEIRRIAASPRAGVPSPTMARKGETLGAGSRRDGNVPSASPQAQLPTQDDIRRVAASSRAAVPGAAIAKKESALSADDAVVAVTEAGAGAAVGAKPTASVETYWLEGNVWESDAQDDKAGREKQAVEFLIGRADSHVAKPRAAKPEQSAGAKKVVLSQQTTGTLPAEQQHLQQLNILQNVPGKRIMTKLERLGKQTQMTFYFDSLVDAGDLANATIETPRRDSLIVNVRNQRIGYRLPPAVDAQELRLTK
jgi:hypothetical protein